MASRGRSIPALDDCTGVILAGGQSRRFGRNKALEPLAGMPLAQRVARVLRELFRAQLLVTNTPEVYASLRIPSVVDDRPGLGSLGGIYTALRHADSPWCFIVGCDMPFLAADAVRALAACRGTPLPSAAAAAPEPSWCDRGEATLPDVVVPFVDGRFHTLHAFYHRRCLPAVEHLLEARRLRIDVLYAMVATRVVDAVDPAWGGVARLAVLRRSLFNINTRDDLRQANALLRAEG
ncbi:MAG: molybdenum cofactor guanylyltransferase [Candidatus Tectomicrobia bacterium]|nr:molybdenum cofactor guanylyltransferase [Candidatus Tectomicrobia bacterium]